MYRIAGRMLQVAAMAAMSTGFGWAAAPDDVTVAVPFEFNVGNQTLPAGEYSIKSDFGSSVVQIRDARYHIRASVIAMPGEKPAGSTQSQLAFRVYGRKHYLGSMWNDVTGNSRELKKTSAERETEMAAGTETRTVLIAHK